MFVYSELHCHSAFSFLDGASLPEELVLTATELGYEALALTDHNSVSGSMEFAQAAKSLGLPKAIHGAEVDLDDGRHLTLIVLNGQGWSNLCRILTLAHAGTRQGAGPLASPPQISLERLREHHEGLAALSGCYTHGVEDEPSLRQLREAFGRDRLYVELQRPYLQGDRARNRRLAERARRLELDMIATGDVHAHNRERALLQDALVAIRLHCTLDGSEAQRRGNFTHVMASPRAMAARFVDHPEAVAASAELSERVEFDLTVDLGYRYPGAEDPTKLQALTELCEARLVERYADSPARVRDAAKVRLTEELAIIKHLNLAGFFILHHELLELAREVALEVRGGAGSPRSWLPPGRGRGSSVSSIVCYLTGLSHVDPIVSELGIGRFLSEDLEALPDIDLDFPRDIRAALIPRIHERFGHERSALVAAFPTYRARGAIREIGKALGLPPGEIERVARSSEGWDARGVGRDIETAFDLKDDPDSRYRNGRWAWLARLAAQAHGLPRHLSQHSGGMVIATRPLIDCCPIVPAAMAGRQIVQWDKDSCADARFLKIDLLGLGMLSAVERCVELVTHTRGEQLDLSRIPQDDPETYAAIQSGQTTGVFQIESRAQMQSLLRTQPQNLQDLAVQVAIVRPGPIQGGAVNPYIERRRRLREDPAYRIPYEHPSLEPALRDTLGALIFQDQVLAVAVAFAGYRPGEAEDLRRAMSRKRSQLAIEAHHRRFVDGAVALHGVAEATAEQVFAKVQGFSGFGFPKAHAAAFGLLAYQSSWLRVHYAPEFLCALLNEQPLGFYPPDALVHEAQRRGIAVLAPDVNLSGVECELGADGSVRIGLAFVRGARVEEIEALVSERKRGGPFRSLRELASRAGAGRPALAALAWSGACDSLVPNAPGAAAETQGRSPGISGSPPSATTRSPRRQVLWELGVAGVARRVQGGVQLSLPLGLGASPKLKELTGWEATMADYETTNLTAGSHPLAVLRPRLPSDAHDSRSLYRLRHGTQVRIAGLVVARQRPSTASGIVFVLLEDEWGTVNLVVPPPVYESHRLLLRTEPLILVEGKLEHLPAAGGAINVLVRRVVALDAPSQALAQVRDLAAPPGIAAPSGVVTSLDGDTGDAEGPVIVDAVAGSQARVHLRAASHSWH